MRVLAEPEDGPWAAHDGQPWLAAFACEVDPEQVEQVELSMASDVTVALRRPGRPMARAGDVLAAGRSTRAAQPKRKRGPQRRAADIALAAAAQQLTAELSAARQALALERERRASLEHALDDERAIVAQLRARLETVEAQLAAAVITAAVEAAAAADPSADVAASAGEPLISVADADPLTGTTVELELEQRTGNGRAVQASTVSEQTMPGDWLDDGAPVDEARDGRADTLAAAPGIRQRQRPATRAPRPLNPSLRHRTWWFGRLLALLILLVVLAAIWIAIRSTLLHHSLSLP